MAPNDALAPLARPMPSTTIPAWDAAVWIGVLDSLPDPGTALPLADADSYRHARFLVRERGLVRGFVEVDVEDGAVDADALRAAAAGLGPADTPPADPALPCVTVVIGTRDRPDQLVHALDSVLAQQYPAFEVVVVDNASRTSETRDLVARLAPTTPVALRCISEPRPGLANARNTGVREATGELIAFTDDDVIADPWWLRRLADGFARHPEVSCVTGLVPSGEIVSPVQAYFEQRVYWASSCVPRVFRLADPPADIPLFPFQVGAYGTGANFAMRRSAVFDHGGFDEAFGVGSPTQGGEDIDMFVRVVVAGQALAFEPSALIWHRHRSDVAALEHQAVGYGLGLGAWLTKVALDRHMNTLAVRRIAAGVRRARVWASPTAIASDRGLDPEVQAALRVVGKAERRAFLTGPAAYRRARRLGLQRAPLSAAAAVASR